MASCHVLVKSQVKFQHNENEHHIPVLYHLEPRKAVSSGSASTLGLLNSKALLLHQHPYSAPAFLISEIFQLTWFCFYRCKHFPPPGDADINISESTLLNCDPTFQQLIFNTRVLFCTKYYFFLRNPLLNITTQSVS